MLFISLLRLFLSADNPRTQESMDEKAAMQRRQMRKVLGNRRRRAKEEKQQVMQSEPSTEVTKEGTPEVPPVTPVPTASIPVQLHEQPKERYTLSGSLGWSHLAFLAIMAPALLFLGIIYAYASMYIPLRGIVTIFLLGGLVVLVRLLNNAVNRFAKNRNAMAVRITAILAGCWTLYASWAFFLAILFNDSVPGSDLSGFSLLLQPQTMVTIQGLILENGWFTVFHITPSGPFLAFIWILEASIVIVVPYILSVNTYLEQAFFCERCGIWCQCTKIRYFKIPMSLSKGCSVSELPALQELKIATSPCLKTALYRCTKCEELEGTHFSLLRRETDPNGKVQDKEQHLPGFYLKEVR